ncbi:MAG TPA: hypothetical protein PKU87_02990, partial [Candidatus Atribacteria bacterium]|nr:hypothetical protein [Candidatus Atribacteria bacterium]
FVIQQGKIIYISHPLFQAYREFGYTPYKTIISNCLKLLLTDPMIQAENLPSTAELTILEQDDPKEMLFIFCSMSQKEEAKLIL